VEREWTFRSCMHRRNIYNWIYWFHVHPWHGRLLYITPFLPSLVRTILYMQLHWSLHYSIHLFSSWCINMFAWSTYCRPKSMIIYISARGRSRVESFWQAILHFSTMELLLPMISFRLQCLVTRRFRFQWPRRHRNSSHGICTHQHWWWR